MSFFVPERRRGYEILDADDVPAATRIRSIADVSRSNVVFGGRRAAWKAVEPVLRQKQQLTLLDVGTGLADIPSSIARRARDGNVRVISIGVDEALDLLVAARDRLDHPVCGNVVALPFRDHSIDVVLCSQLLHHFADVDVPVVIAELDRVARQRVVIADLRRSWIAAAGFWLASFPLRFHAVTRHDGVVSVLRGFTRRELASVVHRATGVRATITRRAGFRLTAAWAPRYRS